MNAILILYHSIIVESDQKELNDRSCDGTASDRWAAEVMHGINKRRARIDALFAEGGFGVSLLERTRR